MPPTESLQAVDLSHHWGMKHTQLSLATTASRFSWIRKHSSITLYRIFRLHTSKKQLWPCRADKNGLFFFQEHYHVRRTFGETGGAAGSPSGYGMCIHSHRVVRVDHSHPFHRGLSRFCGVLSPSVRAQTDLAIGLSLLVEVPLLACLRLSTSTLLPMCS